MNMERFFEISLLTIFGQIGDILFKQRYLPAYAYKEISKNINS